MNKTLLILLCAASVGCTATVVKDAGTRQEELRGAIRERISLLRSEKYDKYLTLVFPTQSIAKLEKEGMLLSELAEGLKPQLAGHTLRILEYVVTRTPEFSEDGTVAAFAIPEDLRIDNQGFVNFHYSQNRWLDGDGAKGIKRYSEEEQRVFIAKLIDSKALSIAIDPADIRTLVAFIRLLVPDEDLRAILKVSSDLQDVFIVELHDDLKTQGMIQSNTRYVFSTCEGNVHIALHPEATLQQLRKNAQQGEYIIRSADLNGKGVLMSKSDSHVGGSVYGKTLLVDVSVLSEGSKGEIVDEKRLWVLLTTLAEKIE
jgi:hypothetical protein